MSREGKCVSHEVNQVGSARIQRWKQLEIKSIVCQATIILLIKMSKYV